MEKELEKRITIITYSKRKEKEKRKQPRNPTQHSTKLESNQELGVNTKVKRKEGGWKGRELLSN